MKYTQPSAKQQLTRIQRAYLREEVYPVIKRHAEGVLMKLVQDAGVTNKDILSRIQQDVLVKLDARNGDISVDVSGVAAAFDSGWDYYDLKLRMLKSRKAKKSKDGQPYIDVPFEHDNIGIIAQAREEAVWLKDERVNTLHTQAEAEDGSKGEFWSKRLVSTGQKGRRGAFRLLAGRHKTGKYRGMTTIGKPMTFRRISLNSAPQAWINKGRRGMNLGVALATDLAAKVQNAISTLRGSR